MKDVINGKDEKDEVSKELEGREGWDG